MQIHVTRKFRGQNPTADRGQAGKWGGSSQAGLEQSVGGAGPQRQETCQYQQGHGKVQQGHVQAAGEGQPGLCSEVALERGVTRGHCTFACCLQFCAPAFKGRGVGEAGPSPDPTSQESKFGGIKGFFHLVLRWHITFVTGNEQIGFFGIAGLDQQVDHHGRVQVCCIRPVLDRLLISRVRLMAAGAAFLQQHSNGYGIGIRGLLGVLGGVLSSRTGSRAKQNKGCRNREHEVSAWGRTQAGNPLVSRS